MNKTMNIALISIAIGILVFGLKYWAYWITGSVALFSDALESTVNVATALVAFFAIRVAAINVGGHGFDPLLCPAVHGFLQRVNIFTQIELHRM